MKSITRRQVAAMLGTLLVAQLIFLSCWSPGLGVDNNDTYTLTKTYERVGLPEDIKKATEVTTSGVDTDDAGKDLNITAAVFSQAEETTSGIHFTYRVGPSPIVWFGVSAVYYRLGNETVHLEFPGSNVVIPRGISPLQSVTSYFHGSELSKWRAGLVDYGAIVYEGLYPGIDLTYKTTEVGLKYEFLVAPGADPSQIKLDFTNADLVEADEHNLRVIIAGEVLEDKGLIALQYDGTSKTAVDCDFQEVGPGVARFVLGDFDADRAVLIDPVIYMLSYSTFLGGLGADNGRDIAVENGFAYITGETYDTTTDYPTTVGANDTIHNGRNDVFVTKLNGDGTALVYSTFLGGSGDDYGFDIAVLNGFAYITGETYDTTTDYPTTVGANDTIHNGGYDAFVTKLSASGTALVYSTFLGGSDEDCGYSIAVEGGFTYVTGKTNNTSTDFPATTGAFVTTNNGGYDAFVTKISADGSSLIYSTFLGGSSDDIGGGIAVEGGFAYVTGETISNFPTTSGAYDTSPNGGYDAFVTKLNMYGTALVYSTLLGGSSTDGANGIAVESGFAYITGYTYEDTEEPITEYPTTAGAFDTTYNGIDDGFVTKLSADGSFLVYSTLIGGSSYDYGQDIAVENGFTYITGKADSANFPTTAGAYNTTFGGMGDAFMTKLSADGIAMAYSTFIGGSGNEYGAGIDVERNIVYITGSISDDQSDFPVTAGAFDTTFNGVIDVFVTKLDTDADNDRMPDSWEIIYGLNPSSNDAILDTDNDGLGNYEEYVQCTDPANPDTDGDWMLDGWELDNGYDPIASEAKITLGHSTLLGGSDTEYGYGIAVENGYAYITGYTTSADFPTTSWANDTVFNGTNDLFVTKLSMDGSALVYSTFLGGSSIDYGYGIAVENGFAYVTGYTGSTNYPTTVGAYDTSHNFGTYDAFVTKLETDGSSLVYSTFLGGSSYDYGYSIAVENEFAYVIGYTNTTANFPTTAGAYDTSNNGGYDVFVTKFDTDGGSIAYSTFLGGIANDYGRSIAVEGGFAYMTGYVCASFPTTVGAYDTTYNSGSCDAFVTKLSTAGSMLVYSTFLGGSGNDYGYGIAVENGFAHITGYTTDAITDYPTTPGAFDTTQNGGNDVFVTKLNADGNILDYSTFLGGSGNDYGYGIAVENGFAHITGYTADAMTDFPTTPWAFDTTQNGGSDVFVTKLSTNGSSLTYSTFLGDSSSDYGYSIGVENGYAYILGSTTSMNFPTAGWAWSKRRDGGNDLFITKISKDVDRDGMPDSWEIANRLDPTIDDTAFDDDNDGLNNIQEYQLGTMPHNQDTDGDDMPDGWEFNYSLDMLADDAANDLDTDGLTNLQEYQRGTDPGNSNSDGDGMPDGWEITNGFNPLLEDGILDADNDDLDNYNEYVEGTDPNNPDTDGDWMLDGWEVLNALSPLVSEAKIALGYSTFIGSTSNDYGYGIAVENGFAYVTGYTASIGYPTTAGACNMTYNGGNDVFVTKLSADGRSLIYSTFLGGSGDDQGWSIDVGSGFVFITGYTYSATTGFPTTAGAFDTTHNGGYDVFVAKLNADGTALVYSTLLGGSDTDYGYGIAVENGIAYITGGTYNGTTNYPTTPGAYDTSHNGGTYDAFVTKLSTDGSSLTYSTLIGGLNYDYGASIAVENGFAHITGYTADAVTDYPTTSGAYDTSYNGGTYDAFVTKLSADGRSLVYSTFLGGSSVDYGYGIAVESGFVYVTGGTFYSTTNYPTTVGAFDTTQSGGYDAFVTKLSTDGTALIYSTFLGGSSTDYGRGIAVENGYAHITGYTADDEFGYPTTSGAYDTSYNGGTYDAFVTKLSANGSTLTYSSLLGGSGTDYGRGIVVENRYSYVTGYAYNAATSFPTTGGVYSETHRGGNDVFITKISKDVDRDGMADSWEVSNGLDPTIDDAAFDNDNDELDNAQECQHGTIPNNEDTDGDGMPDGWEHGYSLDMFTDDAANDPDGDGLTNLQEYQQSTYPGDEDTDGDTMLDGWEVANGLDPVLDDATFDADGDGLINQQEHLHGTNPSIADNDSDGMPDGWEHGYSLNMLVNDAASDLDADGLTNLQEYQQGTDPGNNDTDGDTIPDGWEVENGLDPLLDDASFDEDGDGLTNAYEYQEGTMPHNPDTDGDGAGDGLEVASGTDPLNPASTPASEGFVPSALDYIVIIVAGLACFLVLLVLMSSNRARKQVSRELQELRQSIDKAGSKEKNPGYLSDAVATRSTPSDGGTGKDSNPKGDRASVKSKKVDTK